MADSKKSGISEFSEGSFVGTPRESVRGIIDTTGIPENLTFTFLEEERSIEQRTEISSSGSARSELTLEQVLVEPVPNPVRRTTSVTPVIMATKNVVIDGLTIKVTTVQKTVTSQTVLHPKSERATLDKKEKHDLYARATAKHHKLFDLISLAITSEDKLDDTYNLEMLIEHMRSSHSDYEMGDVFKIISWGVDPISGDLQINGGSKDLYSDYSKLSVESVAQSNEFYRTYVDDETFTENLKLTLDYMKNNVTKNLWNKVLEKYKPFQEKQKGGPLFFKLMMNQLLSNTESAAKALVERVEKYNIGNIQGEEVTKVTSQVASAINRLKQIGKLPPDMTTTLLIIMQTSYVDEFNKVFAAIEVQKTLDDLNQSSTMYLKCFSYTADDILSVAEAQYLKLFEKGQWTGATTKGQYSVFAEQQWTNAKFLQCHNCCKPGCRVDICPNPRDEEKIKLNRQLFMNKKVGGGGEGSGAQNTGTKNKWRKPENGEKGKRHIDGKQWYYHYRSGKWKVVDKTPAQIVAATALITPVPEGAQAAFLTAALPLPTAPPSQDKLKAANLAKLVLEQLNLAMQAEFDNP
jgi:hypothetical protein